MRLITCLLFIVIVSANASASTRTDKVDYLGLAATLLSDGYVQRAKTALEKVEISDERFDFISYYTLKGILLQKTGYPGLSNIFFNAAIEKGQTKKSIYLYIARNHWQRTEYQAVIQALDKAGQAALDKPQMIAMRAEANKQLGEMNIAWSVLDEGIKLHPEYSKFYRQKFYYLLEMGLYKAAEGYIDKYLEAENYSANEYVAVAYTLRENRRYQLASRLLEEGAIKYPDENRIYELLSQVYIDQHKYLEAALVLDWASLKSSGFSHRAAALYLKAKDPVRSLQINRRISNQVDKFRQCISIDIDLDDYESMVAKTDVLTRYDLLADENIVYAMGFAYFKTGDFEKSKYYLKKITNNQLFDKATYLFEQIEKCQNDPFACS
jgi:tetratricopeptide (TPR) repeat protein